MKQETDPTREVLQVNVIYICITTIVQNRNPIVLEMLKFTCSWNVNDKNILVDKR